MTPKQQLAETILGSSLRHYVLTRRRTQPPMAWGDIAIQLHRATAVSVTGESLRTWFAAESPAHR